MASNNLDIFQAIQTGQTSQVRELINSGINLNQETEHEETPLSKAIQLGKTDIVSVLIEAGADCEQLCLDSSHRPLSLACELGNQEIVQLLLNRNVNPNLGSYEGSPIEIAAKHGYINILRILIAAGAMIEPDFSYGQDEEYFDDEYQDGEINEIYGWTPLMSAANGGYLEVVQALVAAGANVNVMDEENPRTALMIAAQGGHKKVFDYLLPLTEDDEEREEAQTEMNRHRTKE